MPSGIARFLAHAAVAPGTSRPAAAACDSTAAAVADADISSAVEMAPKLTSSASAVTSEGIGAAARLRGGGTGGAVAGAAAGGSPAPNRFLSDEPIRPRRPVPSAVDVRGGGGGGTSEASSTSTNSSSSFLAALRPSWPRQTASSLVAAAASLAASASMTAVASASFRRTSSSTFALSFSEPTGSRMAEYSTEATSGSPSLSAMFAAEMRAPFACPISYAPRKSLRAASSRSSAFATCPASNSCLAALISGPLGAEAPSFLLSHSSCVACGVAAFGACFASPSLRSTTSLVISSTSPAARICSYSILAAAVSPRLSIMFAADARRLMLGASV